MRTCSSIPARKATCSHCAGANENPRHKHSSTFAARMFSNLSRSLRFFFLTHNTSSSSPFSSSKQSAFHAALFFFRVHSPQRFFPRFSRRHPENARNRLDWVPSFPIIFTLRLLHERSQHRQRQNLPSHKKSRSARVQFHTSFVSVSFAPNVSTTARSIPSYRMSFNCFAQCFLSF